MSAWLLVTVLASLGNTAALILWQRANEARLDIHNERIRILERSMENSMNSLERCLEKLEEERKKNR